MSTVEKSLSIQDVNITSELQFRNKRTADLRSENNALHELANELLSSPEALTQRLLDTALVLCNAGSVGISVVLDESDDVFRWIAMAGAYKDYIGWTTPRNFSPCGATVEADQPQLFLHPARVFTYFEKARPPIIEGLVIPFKIPDKPTGTIWIVSHDEGTKFDLEDVRVMTTLGAFASVAVTRLLPEMASTDA